jgi:class 3 adenylate cyclase
MVADVVGFSKMLGEDEAGTLRKMADARREVIDPCLGLFRGRVFKELGDGLLAEFPSAVLALRAAVQIQEQVNALNASRPAREQIVFRIGLHQGEVLVQGADLMGDGVNVAARLEPLARAGGICVSHRIREDAMGKLRLDFEDLGERQLKNIAHPVRVYNVHPAAAATAPPPQPAGARVDVTHRIVLPALPGLPSSVVIAAKEPLTLGRAAPPSDFALPSKEVSRQHCRFEMVGSDLLLTDLNSTNGTFLNDEPVEQPTLLQHGAKIRVGSYVLEYEREEDQDADATIVKTRARPATKPEGVEASP